jgi:hypothetical protein
MSGNTQGTSNSDPHWLFVSLCTSSLAVLTLKLIIYDGLVQQGYDEKAFVGALIPASILIGVATTRSFGNVTGAWTNAFYFLLLYSWSPVFHIEWIGGLTFLLASAISSLAPKRTERRTSERAGNHSP